VVADDPRSSYGTEARRPDLPAAPVPAAAGTCRQHAGCIGIGWDVGVGWPFRVLRHDQLLQAGSVVAIDVGCLPGTSCTQRRRHRLLASGSPDDARAGAFHARAFRAGPVRARSGVVGLA
jgi:hypothetical protein